MNNIQSNKLSPFNAKIVERYCLNDPCSSKKTYHITLDLAGSHISYKVGDSLAVLPSNDPGYVDLILKQLACSGQENVCDRKMESTSLRHFLTYRANLTKLSKKFLQYTVEKRHQDHLLQLLDPENRGELGSYLDEHEVIDVLDGLETGFFNAQEFCDLLFPLLPRFYSIASSMKKVGEEAHLTVGLNEYSMSGTQKVGVCSRFLCQLAPLHEPIIPIYLQPSHEFTLSAETTDKPIIMIGPGTGVAPFRGFMQERELQGHTKNWLFFGERHEKSDFFYKDFWHQLQNQGLLKLDVAFSRDHAQKVYVQDCLLKKSDEIWEWLVNGAYLFVCGDASKMAKDVEHTLQQIIHVKGRMDLVEARAYLKLLRTQKRYLRDIY